MNVAICAGGTGGHMFPACALFSAMKEKNHDVTLVTDERGDIYCPGLSKKIVLNTVRFSTKNLASATWHSLGLIVKLYKIWRKNFPDVVIGFGGLFSVIPLFVAKILGSKIVICEQNTVVGKANKLLSRVADLKLSAFGIDSSWKKIAMPVRKEFTKANHKYDCDDIIKILVIGGSQGAKSFSKIIPEALRKLDKTARKKVEIVQQVSHDDIGSMQDLYKSIGVKATLMKFIDNVAEMMSETQLVICRAGASTLSELVEMSRPAILIPLPTAADNHQYENAMYYKERQMAWLIEENDKSSVELANILGDVIGNRNLLIQMADNLKSAKGRNTLDDFVKLIEEIRKGQP